MRISAEFGRALYRARTFNGLTQEEVASKVNISVKWYQRLEKGDVAASFPICVRLGKVLAVDLNQFAEKEELCL